MSKPSAYKLPHLLSLLPHSGRSALVRHAKWPENSFYKVTRSHLKFREADDKVKVGGHAWGMLFWRGKLMPPRKNQPTPKIRGGLKHLWAEVPLDSLSAADKESIVEAEKVVAQMAKESADALAIRRRANLDKIEEAARIKQAERTARLEAAHRDD